MTTTIRAAIATISAIATPARLAAVRAAEAAQCFRQELAVQGRQFPVCVIVPEAEWDRRHAAIAASIYGWQAELATEIEEIAGSVSAGEEIACLHVADPVAPVALWEGSTHMRCECPLCITVGNLQEARKEERKSIWYGYNQFCGCAKCEPLTPPALPTAEADLPTRWEVMGEAGADF